MLKPPLDPPEHVTTVIAALRHLDDKRHTLMRDVALADIIDSERPPSIVELVAAWQDVIIAWAQYQAHIRTELVVTD